MKNKHMKNKGFTLIELLVVLVIITLLATLVGPQLFQKLGSSKVKVAGAQIKLIASALDTFRLDTGHYPSTDQGLQSLIKKPAKEKNWDGPYLADAVPLDPWENAYHYKRPGKEGAYALFTLGQDKTEGGDNEAKDQGKF
jgi:general secretion pathway protein G